MTRRPDEQPGRHGEGDDEDEGWDDGWRERLLRGIAEIALYVIPVLIILGVIWLASMLYPGRE